MTDQGWEGAYDLHERDWGSYGELRDEFEWKLPDEFNIARDICDRWAADKSKVAIFHEADDGSTDTVTFWQLRNAANKLANHLESRGISEGDRIGINTAPKPETAIAHIAAWKLGAVSIPLSPLFGPESLEYRLDDSDAATILTGPANVEDVEEIHGDLDNLDVVLTTGVDDSPLANEFWDAIEGASRSYTTATTTPDDDALLAYTSGTTGDPKGVLHGHRFLLGYVPGLVVFTSNLSITEDDVYWGAGSWAWIAPLIGALYPLYYGKPIFANEREFDPEETFEFIEKYGISNLFIAPTAIRMMMQVDDPADRFDLDSLRVFASGGESLGQSVADWADEVFGGAVVHEGYGQTEINPLVTEGEALFDSKDGTMGRPTVGRTVEILDPETHEPIGAGEVGEIGVKADDDPGFMKEYWNKPKETEKKVQNGWILTGDLATRDEDYYFSFQGRKDDVIITSGYRVGPEEVEDAVARHEAVADVGVIGIPHDVRGEVIKAFVQLDEGRSPSPDLAEDIQDLVRDSLAKHEYPREIEFVDELPQTTTGKIRRRDLRVREGLVEE